MLTTSLSLTTGCAALLSLADYEPDPTLQLTADGGPVESSVPIDAAGPVLASCDGTTCKPHEVCTTGDGGRLACACGFGYSRSAGGACTFDAGPRDPTFELTPPAWGIGGDASIDPNASSGIGGGFTLPTGRGVANVSNGFVAQSFDMPDLSYAEPLALEIFAKQGVPLGTSYSEVGWGAGTQRLYKMDATKYGLTRVCLGERAYGKNTTLQFFGTDVGPYVDYATYVPTADCPLPGTVFDGSFEGSGFKPMNGAALSPGVGVAGSQAGTLTSNGCDDAGWNSVGGFLTGIASVPVSPIGTALRFYQKGPADRRVHVAGGNVPGRGTFGFDEVCLPAWARGLAIDIAFEMSSAIPACSPAAAIIDDASLVTSTACGDGLLFDGGFEGYVSYWTTGRFNLQVTAQIVGSKQRSGAKALEFSVPSCVGSANVYQVITVPPAKGASGPAVAFWTNAISELSASKVKLSLNDVEVTPGLTSYARTVRCLPPQRVGRAFVLDFGVVNKDSNGGCFGVMMVDDVELTVDPACPAQ